MSLVTRQQLADIYGCTKTHVTQQKLPKATDEHGNTIEFYDLCNKEVKDFILKKFKREWERSLRRKEKDLPQGDGTLADEKTKAEILLKDKQARKLDLEFEIKKKDLVESKLIGIYAGYFANGIRTNFLNIGSSIARGDVELRDKIEKMIKKAIERTLDGAEKKFREEGGKIADALAEKEENAQ